MNWVGLFYSLVKFPRIEIGTEFSNGVNKDQAPLDTRTSEGLDLRLHFSFQFKFQKDKLAEIYRFTGGDYERLYQRLARNAVLEIAGLYKAQDYWLKRKERGEAM